MGQTIHSENHSCCPGLWLAAEDLWADLHFWFQATLLQYVCTGSRENPFHGPEQAGLEKWGRRVERGEEWKGQGVCFKAQQRQACNTVCNRPYCGHGVTASQLWNSN